MEAEHSYINDRNIYLIAYIITMPEYLYFNAKILPICNILII